MESITELFRYGQGPSSSHTMGPHMAAENFLHQHTTAASFRITLYGSLALTGKGHLTDKALEQVFTSHPMQLVWKPNERKPFHTNAMLMEAFDDAHVLLGNDLVYSVGGGHIIYEKERAQKVKRSFKSQGLYPHHSLSGILDWTEHTGKHFWEYVIEVEGESIIIFLEDVWDKMKASIKNGLENETVIPGPLNLRRKAFSYYVKSKTMGKTLKNTARIFAYALAVSEENASGGMVITAPTCGSCGVLPGVLMYLRDHYKFSDRKIIHALATAGLVGNLIKHNASISGAEVGCQGEIGTACAMASAAATQLMGGTPLQIEYAAEMGLEHHLGLTCDPIGGLVQIPCIERNAHSAVRAVDAAGYAILSDGKHYVTFDQTVQSMKQTGHDLPSLYKETALGGLAVFAKKQ